MLQASPYTLSCLQSTSYKEASKVTATGKKRKPIKLTHTKLVALGERWLLNTRACSFAFSELCASTSNGETPDNIGFKWEDTILIECKASRADFLSDKRKRFRRDPRKGMGAYRMYLCPARIIQPVDLPQGWGLLWAYPSGAVRQQVGPKQHEWFNNYSSPFFFKERSKGSEHQMMLSALRRLHLRGVLNKIYENPFA